MHQAARWLKVLGLCIALFAPAAVAQEGQGDVVYVPTPQSVVDEMLRMAKVGASDFLIDLGSGDGRIVITAAKRYGARGFGVDLDRYLLKVANSNARKEGVADRARFIEQNLFETDLSQATVITSYLLPEMNERLMPKILALKPGTRVVAHDYSMGEWDPDDSDTLIVHIGQQVARDHRRFAKVGLKQVLLDEARAVGHAFLFRVGIGDLQEVGIEVHPEAARAVLLRRGNDDASVARAEVNHEIVRADFRHFQHCVDHHPGRRHVDHVAAPFLRSGCGCEQRNA